MQDESEEYGDERTSGSHEEGVKQIAAAALGGCSKGRRSCTCHVCLHGCLRMCLATADFCICGCNALAPCYEATTQRALLLLRLLLPVLPFLLAAALVQL